MHVCVCGLSLLSPPQSMQQQGEPRKDKDSGRAQRGQNRIEANPNRIDICHFLTRSVCSACPPPCPRPQHWLHLGGGHAGGHSNVVQQVLATLRIRRVEILLERVTRPRAAGFWFLISDFEFDFIFFYILRCANLIASHRQRKQKQQQQQEDGKRAKPSKRMQRRLRRFKLIKLSIRPVRVAGKAHTRLRVCACVCECVYRNNSTESC